MGVSFLVLLKGDEKMRKKQKMQKLFNKKGLQIIRATAFEEIESWPLDSSPDSIEPAREGIPVH